MFKKKYMLIVGGALVFLVFIIGILSVMFNYVKLNREWAMRELEEQVKSGSKQLQFYFRDMCSHLLRIQRYLANSNMKVDEELYCYLDFVRGHHPDAVQEIFILDANGKVVASTNPASAQSSFQESKYFKNTQHIPNKVYLSEVIIVSDLSSRSEVAPKIFMDPLDLGFVLHTGVYSKGVFKGAVMFVVRAEPFCNRYSMAITKLASGYGFILQEDGRILFHRDVELRGKFLSDLPDSSDLTKANDLLKKTEGKILGYRALGQHMIVTSEICMENQRWILGISTTTSKLAQKTLTLIYTFSGMLLLLGIIIFGLFFSLIRLGQAKESLRESEEKFRMLIEFSPVGIFLDDAQGNAIFINKKCAELVGMPAEKALNLDWVPAIHPRDRERVTTEWAKAVKNGEEFHQEYRWVHSDGEVVWTLGDIVPVRGSDGEVLVYIGTLKDITPRKLAEEELRKHREHLEDLVKERTSELEEKTRELEQANVRLQELYQLKSMFIASMSHELRTPLNSIIGFTGVILKGMTGEINPEQRDQLKRVYGSAKHLLGLINDVIDISKIEAGKFEVCAERFILDRVIKEAVTNLTSEITDKGLGLEISLPQDTQLTTDRKRLLQCILNYLSNAVKFTEKGEIRITVDEVGGMIEIKVKDTGIGIKEEDIPNLFTSFVRLDSPLKTKSPGTGLGLYLTKKIATELLKGSVSVESTYGEGSTFVLKIPKEI